MISRPIENSLLTATQITVHVAISHYRMGELFEELSVV